MTYDGQHMLMGKTNVRNGGDGAIVKVSMDGLTEETFDTPDRHHDFTVLPKGDLIAYIEFEQDGIGTCDRVVELSPDGSKEVIYTVRDDFSHREEDREWCHSNAINYVASEGAYYLSVLRFNSILKIDRASKSLVWTFGGEDSDFPDVSWLAQHGHHVLDESILFFNNSQNGSPGSSSRAVEFEIDETNLEASIIWEYSAGLTSRTYGDVQRLANGNTAVTFSNVAIIHEVDESREIVREISWDAATIGYAVVRDSLYGPPPPFSN